MATNEQEFPMARLPIASIESATGSNQNIFAALQKGLGMVPNMARVMASSPAVLSAYAQFSSAMSTAKLSAKIREQIALLVAESNSCTYCLSAHSALGKLAGLNQAQIDDARNRRSEDPRTAAALTFAQAVLDRRGGVTGGDVDAVRKAGFDDAELAEIVAAVAQNVFTNFFNRAFDVDVDFPRVEAHAAAAR
jgi:uncharacterized peroxidase-related enzyme